MLTSSTTERSPGAAKPGSGQAGPALRPAEPSSAADKPGTLRLRAFPGGAPALSRSRRPDGDRRASFDKTVAMTVLEFAADPAAAVGELCRVTRPGGRVVIGALNPNSPWGLAHRRELRQSPWDHAKFLKGGQLQAMARPYGLVSTHASPLAPCALPGLAWWGRALEAIGRLVPRTRALQVLTITISGR
ncbi:MAG: class I SAM-dependent methyltransferase [Acidimicrobiales bacterium]